MSPPERGAAGAGVRPAVGVAAWADAAARAGRARRPRPTPTVEVNWRRDNVCMPPSLGSARRGGNAAARLAGLVDALESFHGRQAVPPPRGPFELVLWENVAYL